MVLPRIGVATQTMVYVQRNETITRRRQRRSVQQHRRIEAAAETHERPAAVCTKNCGNGCFDRQPAHAAERR
jgi:hypothetical protein